MVFHPHRESIEFIYRNLKAKPIHVLSRGKAPTALLCMPGSDAIESNFPFFGFFGGEIVVEMVETRKLK